MAAYDRSTILPYATYQLEPTSTVADSESDTTNSYYSSDSDSSAAMSTENVVGLTLSVTAYDAASTGGYDPTATSTSLRVFSVVKRNACSKFMPYTTRKVRDLPYATPLAVLSIS